MFVKHAFLTWLLAAALILTGLFWAWHSGIVLDVWKHDVTYLSTLIAVVFFTVFARLGFLAREIDKSHYAGERDYVMRKLSVGVFYGVFCFTLGIIGTILGFIAMLKSGGLAGDLSDPSATSTLLTGIIAHLSTALYCTASGVIAGAIIQKMTFFLIRALEEK